MDSVPTPLSSLAGIDVPLMDVIPYDFKGLWNFGLRIGAVTEANTSGEENTIQFATLLQSWLYFGLLSEFIQAPLNPTDLASSPRSFTSRPSVTFEPMRKLLVDADDQEEKRRRCTLLEDAAHWLGHVENRSICQQYTSPIIEITLSIRMLIYTLAPYSGNPYIDLRAHPLISKRLWDAGWCPSHIDRIENMRNDIVGYYLSCLHRPNPRQFSHAKCPTTNCEASSTSLSKDYVIRHTHADTKPCPLIYVKGDDIRKVIGNGDVPLVSIERLADGNTQLCVRAATPRDQFIAISHVWSDGLGNPLSNSLPNCQLDKLGRYLEDLPNPSSHASFEDDFSPVYSFGPLSLDLVNRTFKTRKSARTTLFWMDTLCIPVSTHKDDEETNKLKKRAINQMATIYGRASQVLVLDSSLQHCRIGLMQRNEILARIAFSNWMGRSWTLQEGALNPFVYLQFADGAVNLLDMMPRPGSLDNTAISVYPAAFRLMGLQDTLKSLKWSWDKRTTQQQQQLYSSTSPYFKQLIYETLYKCCITSLHPSGFGIAKNYYMPSQYKPNISRKSAQWVQQFTAIWNALALRTTTMAEDLPAIFANMLGLDAYAILELPADERMGAILEAGDKLPMALLFNRGERLGANENHWGRWVPILPGRFYIEEVPAMALGSKRSLIIRTDEMLISVRPTLLILRQRVSRESKETFVEASDGRCWHITIHREGKDQLDIGGHAYTAFLIGKSSQQACCLRLASLPETMELEAIYDCPCTAVILKSDTTFASGEALLAGEDLRSWSLRVLSDTDSYFTA